MKYIRLSLFFFFLSLIITPGFSYAEDNNHDTLRIAPLSPNLTEICFALGLKDNIVCVTDNCNYPPDTSGIPKLDPQGSIERLKSFSPNLIIADKSTNPAQILSQYIDAGLDIKITSNDNLEEIYKTITLIGSLTKKTMEADKLINIMKKQVSDIQQLIPNQTEKKVLMVTKGRKLIVCRKGSLQDSLINLAKARNITNGTQQIKNTQQYIKSLMKDNPDVIIELEKDPKTEITDAYKRWAIWKNEPAIKNKQLYIIPSEILLIAGPRITEGFAILCTAIYPEKKEAILKYIKDNYTAIQ